MVPQVMTGPRRYYSPTAAPGSGEITPPDAPHPLYWDSSYEIVLQLIERYPDVNLDSLGLHDLYTMIVTLPGFADDPTLAHDGLLIEIMREYYEEATTHDQR